MAPASSSEVRISVLGAGSFGTALAIQLSRRGTPTRLWGRDEAAIARMQAQRENTRYLPGCPFPAALTATADLREAIEFAEQVLIAVPTPALRATLERAGPLLSTGQGIACACKGLETKTGLLPHQVTAQMLARRPPYAVLSGPTFARELGMGRPTAVTVASVDAAHAERFAHALHGDGFRAYTSSDVIGVEIGGATKNVLAIGVGIADGLKLGANTRAALIARGLNELQHLATTMGALPETIMGLSGLGDLVLTCTDDQSRNRRFGLLVGGGMSVAEALAQIDQVVEGAHVAAEIVRLARGRQVEMPLTEQVARVIAGVCSPLEAVKALSSRPVKREVE
jgi:glycerol-3-phosphate dehydrogenase (NAD(P)+)